MPASWIDRLKLRTLDPDRDASVAIASVPLPAAEHAVVGFKGVNAQTLPLAWHAGDDGPGLPRQVLLMGVAEAGATLPDELSVQAVGGQAIVDPRAASAAPVADSAWRGPKWASMILSEKKTGLAMHEVNELTLEHAGRRLGIRMGIELTPGSAGTPGNFHWWEWLRVERLWAGPVCTAFRAAGYIGVTEIPEDEMFDPARYNAGYWLHRHNWLFAEVYAQVFINGLVRVTARHVNNRFFDQGRDLEGFVPVIAFTPGIPGTPGSTGAPLADTPLDGSRTDFSLGSVQLDIDRQLDILSPEHPGRIRSEQGLTIYQPYEGAEFLLGEGEPADRWKVEANERRMWKGMARSVGFDLSFADQPIRTRRYLPPWGYLGFAGALWPDRALPARGKLESACDTFIDVKHFGPSLGPKPYCSGRYFQASSMWDGEHAHGLMRQAYRTGRRDLYEAAIHHAYAFADVGVDHADFTHQIVGMPKGSISLVLQRGIGMLAAYLETGDPYLLRVTESMADNAYAIDRSNWPRRSFGRDAAYIRTLTRLYDVTGEAFYLRRAGEACRRVAQCQRPDGSYADQGGTYGAHGHLNEIIKPWMSSILCEVMVDYLERAGSSGGDPALEAALVRSADWLLSVLLQDKDGTYFPYQVAWGQNEDDPTVKWRKDNPKAKHPVGEQQLDYNARTLLWVSRHTGDPKYARAWQATFERSYTRLNKTHSTYGQVKVPDNFPWHEAHLWGASWNGKGLTLAPKLDLLEPGREAVIELPDGQTRRVRRTEAGVQID